MGPGPGLGFKKPTFPLVQLKKVRCFHAKYWGAYPPMSRPGGLQMFYVYSILKHDSNIRRPPGRLIGGSEGGYLPQWKFAHSYVLATSHSRLYYGMSRCTCTQSVIESAGRLALHKKQMNLESEKAQCFTCVSPASAIKTSAKRIQFLLSWEWVMPSDALLNSPYL